MNIESIPVSAIILMITEGVFGVLLPLALAFFWRKKKNGKIIPMLIGAATFFVAAVVLEGLNLVVVVVLFDEFGIEQPYDILQALLDRVGADAEVGKRHHTTCGVDFAFEFHVESLRDKVQGLFERARARLKLAKSRGGYEQCAKGQ